MIASFLTFPRVENIFSDDGRSAAGEKQVRLGPLLRNGSLDIEQF